MGLYGVEATPMTVTTGQLLRSRAADALVGRHQSMRAPEAVLSLTRKQGLDLDAEICWRRVRLLRRAWHTKPEWRDRIRANLTAVAERLQWHDDGGERTGDGI